MPGVMKVSAVLFRRLCPLLTAYAMAIVTAPQARAQLATQAEYADGSASRPSAPGHEAVNRVLAVMRPEGIRPEGIHKGEGGGSCGSNPTPAAPPGGARALFPRMVALMELQSRAGGRAAPVIAG
jgi:hypothetical protein